MKESRMHSWRQSIRYVAAILLAVPLGNSSLNAQKTTASGKHPVDYANGLVNFIVLRDEREGLLSSRSFQPGDGAIAEQDVGRGTFDFST
jgi:hypothetical protein